ncbi:hypothetical protein HPB50_004325 [Hyalomma asiaticum]|uniref:Uncharacterized protein n=1 Tax=Hyalomma asiaticum TaxID=266040 RepID=A0ACB7SVJ5_HYAAI|nr:hypothetical protein HPB50_004325 [Hyalomma asiaticum]
MLCGLNDVPQIHRRRYVKKTSTTNDAARGFTYRAAQPADAMEWWWCEAKDRMTEYSRMPKWYRLGRRTIPLHHPGLTRSEAVTFRQLLTGSLPTPVLMKHACSSADVKSEGGKDSDDDPAVACGRRGKRPTGRADTGRPVDFGCPRKAAPERKRQVLTTTPAQGQARVPEGGSSEGCSPSRGRHAEVMCGRIAMTLPSRG